MNDRAYIKELESRGWQAATKIDELESEVDELHTELDDCHKRMAAMIKVLERWRMAGVLGDTDLMRTTCRVLGLTDE